MSISQLLRPNDLFIYSGESKVSQIYKTKNIVSVIIGPEQVGDVFDTNRISLNHSLTNKYLVTISGNFQVVHGPTAPAVGQTLQIYPTINGVGPNNTSPGILQISALLTGFNGPAGNNSVQYPITAQFYIDSQPFAEGELLTFDFNFDLSNFGNDRLLELTATEMNMTVNIV